MGSIFHPYLQFQKKSRLGNLDWENQPCVDKIVSRWGARILIFQETLILRLGSAAKWLDATGELGGLGKGGRGVEEKNDWQYAIASH
jgi:hypothetical protein